MDMNAYAYMILRSACSLNFFSFENLVLIAINVNFTAVVRPIEGSIYVTWMVGCK